VQAAALSYWTVTSFFTYYVLQNNIGSTTEMRKQNETSVAEFILLGFSNFPEVQEQMFGAFLAI
jgi:hypothetical protein